VPAGSASLDNATGHVCWDLESRGADGCGGPSGHGAPSAGFLDPHASPGALVARTSGGRVYLSVNGRAGAFSANQGFFEFDATLR